jgi:hypothetical protein
MILKHLVTLPTNSFPQFTIDKAKSQPDSSFPVSSNGVARSPSSQAYSSSPSLSSSTPIVENQTETNSLVSFVSALSENERTIIKHVAKWKVIEFKTGKPLWYRGRELKPNVCLFFDLLHNPLFCILI